MTTVPSNAGPEEDRLVEIPRSLTVVALAELLQTKPQVVQRELMNVGVLANLNQEIKSEVACRVAERLGFMPVVSGPTRAAEAAAPAAKPKKGKRTRVTGPQPRPAVIVIMGHVDHGKTTLLDTIRKSEVAAGEFGGITQHIGAFQTSVDATEERDGKSVKVSRKLTFLDTPGHEAFTAMRARGSSIADIAVLVVAADDGVMPQTREAIDHARAAGIPMVVAINKIDLEEADPNRVMTELTSCDVVVEDFGGDIGCVQLSAATGLGVDDLLDRLELESELLELKADPTGPAEGVIIEARLDPGRGPVATVLIDSGTLTPQDSVVVGSIYGRIKALTDDRGNRLKSAGPATPVEILGLSSVPHAGDRVIVVDSDREARQLAQEREVDERERRLGGHAGRLSLERLFEMIQQGDVKELNVILKGDVQGSVEAIQGSLEKLSTSEVRVNILRAAVGAIGENDILLASASNAIVLGFNVKADPAARRAAEDSGIEVRTFRIIYELIDAVTAAMKGLLAPVYEERILGRAEVRATFRLPSSRIVAGCYVSEGTIRRGADVRVFRGKELVHDGEIGSLRHVKENVREINAGYECGIILDDFDAFEVGDTLECYDELQIDREL